MNDMGTMKGSLSYIVRGNYINPTDNVILDALQIAKDNQSNQQMANFLIRRCSKTYATDELSENIIHFILTNYDVAYIKKNFNPIKKVIDAVVVKYICHNITTTKKIVYECISFVTKKTDKLKILSCRGYVHIINKTVINKVKNILGIDKDTRILDTKYYNQREYKQHLLMLFYQTVSNKELLDMWTDGTKTLPISSCSHGQLCCVINDSTEFFDLILQVKARCYVKLKKDADVTLYKSIISAMIKHKRKDEDTCWICETIENRLYKNYKNISDDDFDELVWKISHIRKSIANRISKKHPNKTLTYYAFRRL